MTGKQPSPAAQRMRRSRERQRKALACFIIEIKRTEIDELVRRGFIPEAQRHDYNAVLLGLYRHLDQTLGKQ